MSGYLKVELLHSAIARSQRQKDTLRGLGLRRRHQQRILKDTPAIRGLIGKVFDLVRFEKTSEKALPKASKIVTYHLGPVPTPKPKVEKPKAKAKSTAETEKHGAEGGPAKKAGATKASKDKKSEAKAHRAKPAAKKSSAKKK
jgi:large subunit ribosomal protein L30